MKRELEKAKGRESNTFVKNSVVEAASRPVFSAVFRDEGVVAAR